MRQLRKHLVLLFLLTAMALLPACGKKGPLYLPEPTKPPAPAKQSAQQPAQVPATTATPTPTPTPTTTPETN